MAMRIHHIVALIILSLLVGACSAVSLTSQLSEHKTQLAEKDAIVNQKDEAILRPVAQAEEEPEALGPEPIIVAAAKTESLVGDSKQQPPLTRLKQTAEVELEQVLEHAFLVI